MDHPILIVPGWQDSEEGHWQTLWEKQLGATRVKQDDWMKPSREGWVTRLDEAVRAQSKPPLIIAHSLGCNTVAILSEKSDCAIAGAFLVAPPDLEQEGMPPEVAGFLPVPAQRLRFPSVLVASSNDPYCSFVRAQELARNWGCNEFHDIGPRGHINVAAGYGNWAEGLLLLRRWTGSLRG